MGKLAPILAALGRQLKSPWAGPVTSFRVGKPQSPALVCQLSGSAVECAYLRPEGAAAGREVRRITCADDAAAVLSSLGGRCLTVAVLPKSHYLVRSIEVPKVGDEEVRSVLALEVEAVLPREFGPPEVAYRLLGAAGDGLCKYEVYVSGREELRGYLGALADLGVRPDIVLPSAVVWSQALKVSSADVLVALSSDTGYVEAALVGADSTASVRMLQRAGGEAGSDLALGLSECIRSAMAGKNADSAVLKVGWIGLGCPSSTAGERVSVEDMSGAYLPSSEGEDTMAGCEPLPHIAARCLPAINGDCSLDEANLLPQDTVLARKRAGVYRALAVGAALVLLGFVVLYAAIQVAIIRYGRLNDELSAKTALIRTEGERAERRVSQLKAILGAQGTGGDFHEIVSGLLAATPPGVSYSRVELADTGEIRLRGHAESVSLPFLLPEKLKREPIFRQAVLRSAGQQKRGAGSTTEFRLDCALRRGGSK